MSQLLVVVKAVVVEYWRLMFAALIGQKRQAQDHDQDHDQQLVRLMLHLMMAGDGWPRRRQK
jgi:hypothetical protein